MIFDNIANIKRYTFDEDIREILEYMAHAHSMPEEKIELSDNAFINPVSFISKERSAEKIFESHTVYADIHFILEGCEQITVALRQELCPAEKYDESKDIVFYSGNGGTVFTLYPGDFLICYPGEAHEVAIAPDECSQVKKLVGKFRC